MSSENIAPIIRLPISPEMLRLQKTLCSGKTVIGIDIGISSISIAQTALHRGRPTLVKCAVQNINIENEREREYATVTALKSALSEFNTKHADIICVLPGRQTAIECLTMPVMPLEELAEAVKLEVSSSKHFSIDRPVTDFQVIGRTMDRGVEKMLVLVAAASRSAVDGVLGKFIPQKAMPLAGMEKHAEKDAYLGLAVSAVIPMSIAIENIIKKSKIRLEETLAIMKMGSVTTELNIYRNSQLEFSRAIPVTGHDITRSLTGALFTNAGRIELTIEEAEWIKKEHGIPSPGENYLIKDKISSAEVLSLLRPKLEQLTAEIIRSFDYYHEKLRAEKMDRLIIFGGGARLKRLQEFLSMELGLPVHVGDPLQDVELLYDGVVENKEEAQRLVQAIGASLGDPNGINLIPAQLKDMKRKSFERMVIVAATSFLLALTGLAWMATQAQLKSAREELSQAESDLRALVPELEQLKEKLLLQMLVRNRLDWGGVFKQLSYLPAEAFLTKLSYSAQKITLSGVINATAPDTEKVTAQIADALNKTTTHNAAPVPQKGPGKSPGLVEFKVSGNISFGEEPAP